MTEAYRVKCEHLSSALTPNFLLESTDVSSFVWAVLVFCYVVTHVNKNKHSVYIRTNGITRDMLFSNYFFDSTNIPHRFSQ